MTLGLTKKQARSLINRGKLSWPDLALHMERITPIVRKVQGQSSKIAKGVPIALLFHMYSRTAKRLTGDVKGSDHEETALGLLREFGRTLEKGKS